MFGKARHTWIVGLAISLIIGTTSVGSVLGDSVEGEEISVLWDKVLKNPMLTENLEVVLIYKPLTTVTEDYAPIEGDLGENRSGIGNPDAPNDPPLDLTGLDVIVIEDYPAFTAALGSNQTAKEISQRGYHVEIIDRVPIIGRGAFYYDFRKELPNVPPEFRLESKGMTAEYPFLLKFLAPSRSEWLNDLEIKGVEVLDYAGFWTYLVNIEGNLIPQLLDVKYIACLEPYHYGYRVSKNLMDILLDEETSPDDEVSIVIVGMPDEDGRRLDRYLEEMGFDLNKSYDRGDNRVVRLDTNVTGLRRIIGLGQVMWIDQTSSSPVVQNDQAVGILQTGQIDNTPIHDAGIIGQGQIITFADTGLDTDHEAFSGSGKVHGYTWWEGGDGVDLYGHGTHVAGTLAGDASPYNMYSDYDGHAFGASLYVQDIGVLDSGQVEPPEPYDIMFSDAKNQDSWIHSNSWGRRTGGNPYNEYCVQIDEFMYNNPDFLILYAAGNEGPVHQPNNLLRDETNAKNIISVGGTKNGGQYHHLYHQSSRGPSGDGRLKPTLVAPALEVASSVSSLATTFLTGCVEIPGNPAYYRCSGTSMATPAVAGAATLVRQYFTDGWYPTGEPVPSNSFEPSAALIKATLIASTEEILGDESGDWEDRYRGMWYPNNAQGWGIVRLDNALYLSEHDEARRLLVIDERKGLQTGETNDFVFTVGTSIEPLKVTLVWTDQPGADGCHSTGPCLTNNLNLQVFDPSGNLYKGNVFPGGLPPRPEPAESQTGGSYDYLNVEEVVLRYSPLVGQWRVRVLAQNTPTNPQPFALVVTGDLTSELRLNPVTGSNSNPSIATDSQGNTHVVWTQSLSESDKEIWYAKYDENGNLLKQEQLTTPDDDIYGDEQFGPVVAVGPDDAIYVVYANRHEYPSQGLLQYLVEGKKSTDGGDSWDGTIIPTIYQTYNSHRFKEIADRADPIDIYVDTYNTVHLTWSEFIDDGALEHESILYAEGADGGTAWIDQPIPLFEEPAYPDPGYPTGQYHKLRYPKVVKGQDQYVHVVFSREDEMLPDPIGGPLDGLSEVWHVRYYGSIGHPTIIGYTNYIGRYNDLAADEGGSEVFAIWHDSAGGDYAISGAYSDDDGSPGSWNSVPITGIPGNSKYTAIQMDSSGFVHLVYTTDTIGGVPMDEEVLFASSLDGGQTWHERTRVTSSDGRSSWPTIALNRHDTFEIAWFDERTGSRQIFHKRLPVMNRVTYQSEDSYNPSIAVDSAGTSHTVWVDYREGDADIYYARFDKEGNRLSVDTPLTDATDDADGDEQFGPVIAIGPDDAIYAIYANRHEWPMSNGLEYQLDGKKSLDGGLSWVDLTIIQMWRVFYSHGESWPPSLVEIVDRADPIDIYIDSSNMIHLVWSEFRSELDLQQDRYQYETVFYARASNGGAIWVGPMVVYEEPAYLDPGYDHYNRLRFPKVAKGQYVPGPPGFNYVHAIFSWEDDTDPIGGPWDGNSEVRYSRTISPGSPWESYQVIGLTNHIARNNDLSTDENGEGVVAVWHNYVGTSNVYYTRSFDHGLIWSHPPGNPGIVDDDSGYQRYPTIVTDSGGHMHVLYSHSSPMGSADEIRHRALTDASDAVDAAWSDIRQITLPWGGDEGAKRHPAAATSLGGTLYVAWQDDWGSSADWREIYILAVF